MHIEVKPFMDLSHTYYSGKVVGIVEINTTMLNLKIVLIW